MEIQEARKTRRKRAEGTRRNVTYQRYNKPPYSYLGMIAVAIETSPRRMMTLVDIHNALREMFPFFTGPYTGWRDSVRHNLSHNPCFYKVVRETKSIRHPKGNYWKVDLTKVCEDAFQRQSSKNISTDTWSKTLQEQLRLPPISLDPLLESVSTKSEDAEEIIQPNKVKKGVKNFKIDTILKAEVKDENESSLGNKDDICRSGLHGQHNEYGVTRYVFPGVVFRDNPHLAVMLTEAARQCHGNHKSAIDNLRSLCPPANYGTPPTLHRRWTTQATSPYLLPTNVFSRTLTHGVNHDHIVDSTSEPMDLTGTDREDLDFGVPQYETPDIYFSHNETVACHAPKNETACAMQHFTTNSMRHSALNSNFSSQFSNLDNGVTLAYCDESLNLPVYPVPSTPTYLCDYHSSYIIPTNSPQAPHHHVMMSPTDISVSLEDSRSSFTSATCQSHRSPASTVSSFASLQDMMSDTASQMSDDVFVYHESNGMFMSSVENSSGTDVTRDSPTVSNTHNLDMLATWALSRNVPDTFVQP